MKLTDVVVACDDNPCYSEFYPIVQRAWEEHIGVRCHLVFIGSELPAGIRDAPRVTRIQPIKGAHDAFVAQTIRPLFPCTLESSGGAVIISDMDMLPLSRRYYVDSIKDLPDSAFVTYRDVCAPNREIAICYNAALPNVWRRLFPEVAGLSGAIDLIRKWAGEVEYTGRPGGPGWNFDQKELWRRVNANLPRGNYVPLNDGQLGFRRLDRSDRNITTAIAANAKRIAAGEFTDYHMLRPYGKHKSANDAYAHAAGRAAAS